VILVPRPNTLQGNEVSWYTLEQRWLDYARCLPDLAQSQAAHQVARTNLSACISTDDKGLINFFYHL